GQQNTVWQLWTPNKALGLTGIRAAYAIAPLGAEAAIEKLNQLCPSWPIGAHGFAMLQAWVHPETQIWLADSLKVLRGWKARQVAAIESLGWVCLPSDANFFCVRPVLPPSRDLPTLLAVLRGQRIKLRDTASFGLSGHVRVSVQAPEAQAVLFQALMAHSSKN
ncbi:MAG: aminotransferase class I/II-fold pyridoxal phosphate-dependent enzyme, partial [Pseudomonadota bacterium]